MHVWKKRNKKKTSSRETPESFVINKKELLTPFRKGSEFSFMLAGLIVWFFMLRPFLILLLWILGFKFFLYHMVYLKGISGLFEKSILFLSIILIIFSLVRGWNIYNFTKFKNANQRKNVRDASGDDLESFFHLRKGELKKIHAWKTIVVEFSRPHNIKFNSTINHKEKDIEARFKSS